MVGCRQMLPEILRGNCIRLSSDLAVLGSSPGETGIFVVVNRVPLHTPLRCRPPIVLL